jgi:hypothetical protein
VRLPEPRLVVFRGAAFLAAAFLAIGRNLSVVSYHDTARTRSRER